MDEVLVCAVDGDAVEPAELDVAGGAAVAVGEPGDLVRRQLPGLLTHKAVGGQGARGDEVLGLDEKGMHLAAGVVDLHHARGAARVDGVRNLGKFLHRVILGGADALEALQAGGGLDAGQLRHDQAHAALGAPAVEGQGLRRGDAAELTRGAETDLVRLGHDAVAQRQELIDLELGKQFFVHGHSPVRSGRIKRWPRPTA